MHGHSYSTTLQLPRPRNESAFHFTFSLDLVLVNTTQNILVNHPHNYGTLPFVRLCTTQETLPGNINCFHALNGERNIVSSNLWWHDMLVVKTSLPNLIYFWNISCNIYDIWCHTWDVFVVKTNLPNMISVLKMMSHMWHNIFWSKHNWHLMSHMRSVLKMMSHIWHDMWHEMCSLWSKQILQTWSLLKGELSQAQEQVSLLNESGSKQWAKIKISFNWWKWD